jgi:O-antigen ligase
MSSAPARHSRTLASDWWRWFAAQPLPLQVAAVATILLPPALLAARAVADTMLSVVALLFLLQRIRLRGIGWLRPAHVWLGLLFWAWLVLCTALGGTAHAFGEALAVIRLFLFAAALQFWVLQAPPMRRGLQLMILACALAVIIETWHQWATGHNLLGYPRWPNGALTGPFREPRAGAVLQLLYFVAFLPAAMRLLAQRRLDRRLAGAALLVLALLTEALIGQRMPMLLVLFGLLLTGLFARPLRWPIAAAVAILVAAVAATPVLAPTTYATLVVEFLRRMEHFWSTPYALLYQRAVAMVTLHPWLGLGFDGFRDNCSDPAYFHATPWLPVTDIGDPAGCTIHPHNYWLQVATSAGLPGVALFAALAVVWLRRVGGGLLAMPSAIQVALFVTLCTALWPIASTTALFTVPNAGFLFLLVGWGLAEADAAQRPAADGPASAAATPAASRWR